MLDEVQQAYEAFVEDDNLITEIEEAEAFKEKKNLISKVLMQFTPEVVRGCQIAQSSKLLATLSSLC